MLERQSIYMKREAGLPPPWTNDSILQKYKFCNIYREDDRVSKWIQKNVVAPYHNHELLWFMLVLARRFNWPPTLQELMDKGAWPNEDRWSAERTVEVLHARQQRGDKVYTGAFMVSNGLPSDGSRTQVEHTTIFVCGEIWSHRKKLAAEIHSATTLQGVYKTFLRHYGWGLFVSYQIALEIYQAGIIEPCDVMTWSQAGPGSTRGLNRVLFSVPDNIKKFKPDDFNTALSSVLFLVNQQWPKEFKQLEMHDIEHALCEFDKYERTRLGQGKPRSNFIQYKE